MSQKERETKENENRKNEDMENGTFSPQLIKQRVMKTLTKLVIKEH